MSTFLYRLGKSAYSKPWYFILFWIVVLGVVGTLLGINGIQSSSEMKIEGTESQKCSICWLSFRRAVARRVSPLPRRRRTSRYTGTCALLAKAINDVYNMEYIINPMELAARRRKTAADPAQRVRQPT